MGLKDRTGLRYQRNRYYDPQSGQFTQQDPLGIAGGLNLYGFAGGDPINFSDPFGLCPEGEDDFECELFQAGMAALGATIGAFGGGGAGALLTAASGGAAALTVVALSTEGALLGATGGAALGELRRKLGSLGRSKGRDALRRENRVVRDVVRELKLNRDQRQQLHREISGQGLDYQGILQRARDLFGGP